MKGTQGLNISHDKLIILFFDIIYVSCILSQTCEALSNNSNFCNSSLSCPYTVIFEKLYSHTENNRNDKIDTSEASNFLIKLKNKIIQFFNVRHLNDK